MGNLLQTVMSFYVPEEKHRQYLLTYFYDMLRDDSSTFSVFEDALKKANTFHSTLVKLLSGSQVDTYSADKAAWLLTACIGNIPTAFNDREVQEVATVLQRSDAACSELGVLEAIANMLKADAFRKMVCVAKRSC